MDASDTVEEPSSLPKPKILFLCEHNSARSQIAEAILKQLSDGRLDVYSAGIRQKDIKPKVFEVMSEAGVSMDGSYSKTLDEMEDLGPFDYTIIVCKTDDGQCPLVSELSDKTLCWNIEGPFPGRRPADLSDAEKLTHYRSLRSQIESHINQWLTEVLFLDFPTNQFDLAESK